MSSIDVVHFSICWQFGFRKNVIHTAQYDVENSSNSQKTTNRTAHHES